MKKLYILSGPQASGKSTFIKDNNLEEYTISLDKLRDLYISPETVFENGKISTKRSARSSSQAFKLANDLISFRLMNCQTTIIDATNVSISSVKEFKKIADKYLAKTIIVKFGRDVSVETLIKRDSNRTIGFVGEKAIRKYYNRMIDFDRLLPNKFNLLTPSEFLEDLNWKSSDITNKYKEIAVIGDVHSCGTALESIVSDFKKDRLYVLLGDNFDRGIEHTKTMKIILDLLKKPNVVSLLGNHEKHIFSFASGQSISGFDFKSGTLPELMRSGFELSDFRKIINKSQPLYICEFNGSTLYFSHSGFLSDQIKDNDIKIRAAINDDKLYTEGLGGYSIDLDDKFNKVFKGTNIYQFHGHRNSFLTPVLTNSEQHSFNLEQKVEHGNKLGAVLIKKDGKSLIFEDISVSNDIYDSENFTRFDEFSEPYDFNNMIRNKYVKVNDLRNGIKCLNFTSDAFFEKVWNFDTIKARGLFIDSANHIVARGYEKFFNINEVKNTGIDYVVKKFKEDGLVKKVNKENGFLGIVSYIPELGGLQIFSKGAGEEYSALASETIINHLLKNGLSLGDFESFVKKDYDNGIRYSQTFEIIDPIKDPHIVNYDDPKVVLLDVIFNKLTETIDNEMADKIAEKFNFERPGYEFVNTSEMTIDEIKFWLLNLLNEKEVEGYVLISDSTRVKIKTNWYSSRKRVRSVLERAVTFESDKAKVNIIRSFADKNKDTSFISKDSISAAYKLADDIEVNGLKNIVFTNNNLNIPKTYKNYKL